MQKASGEKTTRQGRAATAAIFQERGLDRRRVKAAPKATFIKDGKQAARQNVPRKYTDSAQQVSIIGHGSIG